MQLFYAPEFTSPLYTLEQSESRHCIKVLRLKEGDTLHITDGRGNLFYCAITEASPKGCQVKVLEHIENYNRLPYRLTIAVAPTKSTDRYEWFLEKATEIGISEIYPIESFHSERRRVKAERDERIISSAMKQSLKAYLPTLHPLTPLEEILKMPFDGAKYIAHCNESQNREYLFDLLPHSGDILILIGPEGDFSPEEVQRATAAGFKEISLGEQRLRTETAAVVATTMVSIKSESKA